MVKQITRQLLTLFCNPILDENGEIVIEKQKNIDELLQAINFLGINKKRGKSILNSTSGLLKVENKNRNLTQKGFELIKEYTKKYPEKISRFTWEYEHFYKNPESKNGILFPDFTNTLKYFPKYQNLMDFLICFIQLNDSIENKTFITMLENYLKNEKMFSNEIIYYFNALINYYGNGLRKFIIKSPIRKRFHLYNNNEVNTKIKYGQNEEKIDSVLQAQIELFNYLNKKQIHNEISLKEVVKILEKNDIENGQKQITDVLRIHQNFFIKNGDKYTINLNEISCFDYLKNQNVQKSYDTEKNFISQCIWLHPLYEKCLVIIIDFLKMHQLIGSNAISIKSMYQWFENHYSWSNSEKMEIKNLIKECKDFQSFLKFDFHKHLFKINDNCVTLEYDPWNDNESKIIYRKYHLVDKPLIEESYDNNCLILNYSYISLKNNHIKTFEKDLILKTFIIFFIGIYRNIGILCNVDNLWSQIERFQIPTDINTKSKLKIFLKNEKWVKQILGQIINNENIIFLNFNNSINVLNFQKHSICKPVTPQILSSESVYNFYDDDNEEDSFDSNSYTNNDNDNIDSDENNLELNNNEHINDDNSSNENNLNNSESGNSSFFETKNFNNDQNDPNYQKNYYLTKSTSNSFSNSSLNVLAPSYNPPPDLLKISSGIFSPLSSQSKSINSVTSSPPGLSKSIGNMTTPPPGLSKINSSIAPSPYSFSYNGVISPSSILSGNFNQINNNQFILAPVNTDYQKNLNNHYNDFDDDDSDDNNYDDVFDSSDNNDNVNYNDNNVNHNNYDNKNIQNENNDVDYSDYDNNYNEDDDEDCDNAFDDDDDHIINNSELNNNLLNNHYYNLSNDTLNNNNYNLDNNMFNKNSYISNNNINNNNDELELSINLHENVEIQYIDNILEEASVVINNEKSFYELYSTDIILDTILNIIILSSIEYLQIYFVPINIILKFINDDTLNLFENELRYIDEDFLLNHIREEKNKNGEYIYIYIQDNNNNKLIGFYNKFNENNMMLSLDKYNKFDNDEFSSNVTHLLNAIHNPQILKSKEIIPINNYMEYFPLYKKILLDLLKLLLFNNSIKLDALGSKVVDRYSKGFYYLYYQFIIRASNGMSRFIFETPSHKNLFVKNNDSFVSINPTLFHPIDYVKELRELIKKYNNNQDILIILILNFLISMGVSTIKETGNNNKVVYLEEIEGFFEFIGEDLMDNPKLLNLLKNYENSIVIKTEKQEGKKILLFNLDKNENFIKNKKLLSNKKIQEIFNDPSKVLKFLLKMLILIFKGDVSSLNDDDTNYIGNYIEFYPKMDQMKNLIIKYLLECGHFSREQDVKKFLEEKTESKMDSIIFKYYILCSGGLQNIVNIYNDIKIYEFHNQNYIQYEYQDQTEISEYQNEEMNKAIEKMVHNLLPSSKDLERLKKFEQKLLKIVSDEWPMDKLEVHLFGSSVNGLWSNQSDVDLCIFAPYKNAKCSNMRNIARLLRKKSLNMENVVPIINTRIPICKFTDTEFKLHCDISCNNRLPIYNSELIRCYMDLDDRVRDIIMIIKKWAQLRDINNSKERTFSSFTYVLLSISFFQNINPPVLPNLQSSDYFDSRMNNKDLKMYTETVEVSKSLLHRHDKGFFLQTVKYYNNIEEISRYFKSKNNMTRSELLIRLFKFYGLEYDYKNNYSSIQNGGFKTYSNNNAFTPTIFAVQDPFIAERVVNSNSGDEEKIRIINEFKRAYYILIRPQAKLEDIF